MLMADATLKYTNNHRPNQRNYNQPKTQKNSKDSSRYFKPNC